MKTSIFFGLQKSLNYPRIEKQKKKRRKKPKKNRKNGKKFEKEIRN